MAIKKTETIAPFLQTLFLIVIVSTWLAGLAVQIIFAARVYLHNPNLSSFYTTFLYSLAIPVLLFALMAFLNRRYKQNRRVMFENVLVTLIGVTFCSFIGYAVQMAMSLGRIVLDEPLGWWWLEIATAVVSFALYVGALLFARRTGRWN